MELLFLSLALTIFFLLLLHGFELYLKRKLPPGPVGFPVIGNLLDIGPKPYESLAKLARKHGPLMTIRLGTMTTVVASTPDVAREILQKNDKVCSGRVMQESVAALKHPKAAIVWMPPNETWRGIKKALNIGLMNPNKLDTLTNIRQNVVDEMIDFLQKSLMKRSAVDIGKLAFTVALNQMSNTLFSENVTSYDSNNAGRFRLSVDRAFELHVKLNIADLFPIFKLFDPQNIRGQVKEAYQYLDEVIEGFVDERLKYRESELSTYGDILDSLLDYIRDEDAKFDLTHIKTLLVDLFLGGTDTNSTTITWIMTELLRNPDMLLTVRKEISQTVGEDGKINETKILDLPYLQAVIKETMRLHFAVPLLVPHKTLKDVKLGEYTIPTNTQILVNAWAMARDPKYWESPTVFMPERFLGNRVDFKGQHFEFIPFGSGRRKCPGMSLAHRMVSLIVASFVYNFDWELPHAREEIDMDDVFRLSIVKAKPLIATLIPLKSLDKSNG